MRRVVWKYPLNGGENCIKTPGLAQPLAVGWQGEQLFLWCAVRLEEPERVSYFFAAATGEILPDDYGPYVGSAQSRFGIVAHVFRMFKEVL